MQPFFASAHARPLALRFSPLSLIVLMLMSTPGYALNCTVTATGTAGLPEPVMFVTQFPIEADFATIGSTFANHFAGPTQVGRGGDLWILYTNGTLRNLTCEAGFGTGSDVVFQGTNSIAVRDPFVHPNGNKALFSMIVGNAGQQYQVITSYWQIYEITGFGQGQTPVITKLAHQPTNYNNITPIYSPDGRIIFTSDRPRDGQAHLYPQHDEYESTPTNTGLWVIDPITGNYHILNHTPSGAFTPTVDSFGRIIFTRWDHLQRDQQADGGFNVFDFASEDANAAILAPNEIFPEPRIKAAGSTVEGFTINHFFPWQIRPDGTDEETLNHIGRHELHNYFNFSLDNAGLEEFIAASSGRVNGNSITNFFHIAESATQPGRYFGIDAPEFGTHSGGMVVRMDLPPGQAPDHITVTYITHPATRSFDTNNPPSTNHSGFYRDPEPLSNGTVLVAHADTTLAAANLGTRAAPNPRYKFRLQQLKAAGNGFQDAGALLTSGISRHVTFWDPDVQVDYNGNFWELQPVAVRVKTPPPVLAEPALKTQEANVFTQQGVDVAQFRQWLRDHNLALIVSRNLTLRDFLDKQQPYNLQVPGGVKTVGDADPLFFIKYLQLLQADQVRGISFGGPARPGRRVLARTLHDPAVTNPPITGPTASVQLGLDGSMAAFVPARRALTWQLTDSGGVPVVRERYWVTFQPGEIRLCTSCHGLSSKNQAGGGEPTNEPEALRSLLNFWKTQGLRDQIFSDHFE